MSSLIKKFVHGCCVWGGCLLITACSVATKTEQAAVTDTSALSNAQQVMDCDFTPVNNWWTQAYAALPSDVANNPVTGEPEFCEFYQFSQDWFLYLISPSASTPGQANWQDETNFPILQTSGNSCAGATEERALTIRTAKSVDDSQDPVLPERTDQAGAHAIYDQTGNVVFYEVLFSRNLCNYAAIQAQPNFPGKTVELKMGWKVLTASDNANDYVQSSANIDGQNYTLGLIGWHIVVAADNHPEFVWATLDHKNNAIDCSDFGAGQSAHSFTSAACATDQSQCNALNQTQPFTSVSLPSGQSANDICQEFPFGTVEGGGINTKNGLNIALIEKLNGALTQAFAQPGLPTSLPVWENYQVTGALWESDITQNSSVSSNQRGSLELANDVLETSFQGTASPYSPALNCFGCHNYSGTASGVSNTAFAADLSHSFDEIILGQCMDVASSNIINSQSQAEATCPSTCSTVTNHTKWNGQWTNQGVPMSVCGCCPSLVN